MKKILAILFVIMSTVTFSYANNDFATLGGKKSIKSFQNRYRQSEKSWFLSAGVGAQVYFGDHDKQIGIGKRISPKFEISGGAWFGPTFGARLNVNTAKMKGLTQLPELSNGKLYRVWDGLYYQEFNYINVHADFLFNWSNDASGVDPDRVYTLIPYVGVGVFTVIDKQKGINFSPNLGLIQSFKVSDQIHVNLDIKGNLLGDGADGERGGRNFEGIASAMVAVQYTIF